MTNRPDTFAALDRLVDTGTLALRDEAYQLLRERDADRATIARLTAELAEAEPPLTDEELSAGIAGLSMENLRLRAALTDIAAGECCGFCGDDRDPDCEVMTARKVLA